MEVLEELIEEEIHRSRIAEKEASHEKMKQVKDTSNIDPVFYYVNQLVKEEPTKKEHVERTADVDPVFYYVNQRHDPGC
jgi:hypothetical protein